MTEIDRLSRLMTEVRATLSEKTQRGTTASRSSPPKSRAPSTHTLAREEIRKGLIDTLKALGPITDSNRRTARRRFVEWAVLGELGFQLAEDNNFQDLATRILDAIETDEAVTFRLDGYLASFAKT